ncbi:enoyl-CoA delta isomerase 2, peroxisomal-like isoform X3 [Orbicella faveolata]|uniref:enoyl-CoA delta isomerase 2, peroxisomal-like isoform X3 n=1 Tax=Orbicella faveolata TaxID=48498 RepID=UPI0009E44469|nr:enoyl-CoA delta isomerase 2, peroxisomal-like isoform X3 [Orbicella faveolata]
MRCKKVQFLITTGDGKFYSNGLDQTFLKTCSTEEFMETFNLLNKTLIRFMTFPVLTVAAINGHAFALGAILALAHDYRVMRTKKGWFCLPEVKYDMLFGKATILLLRAKIKEPKVLTDAVLMGWRFVAEEALSGGIVQKICDIEDLLNTAVHMGQAVIGQNIFKRDTIKHLKSQLYSDIINAFQSDTVSRQGVLQSIAQFDRKSKL